MTIIKNYWKDTTTPTLPSEVWKNVKTIRGNNYAGLYAVSNLGRVKTLPRKHVAPKGGTYYTKETILKQNFNNGGYLHVNFQHHSIDVHKLVALLFLPNPNRYECVNHKNEIKTENYVSNLEWCTKAYNNSYNKRAVKIGNKQRNNVTRCKKVAQYTKSGEFVKTYPSAMEAQRHGFWSSSVIACCRGKRKTANGYIWKYV